jgi:outer membrane protein assembly factor BamB
MLFDFYLIKHKFTESILNRFNQLYMKKANLIFSIAAALILFSSTDSFSQDWPQWRGITRDSKVTGFKVPLKWPAELIQQWKIKVGKGDASPILVGGKIYLITRQGGDEVILCLDATTGKEIWRNSYPAPVVTGPDASHGGPRSTPSFSDNKVVTLGIAGVLSCYEASTGKIFWRKEHMTQTASDSWSALSPLIIDGLCIVSAGKKDTGIVVAYDLKTGNEKWKWNGEGPSSSSPSVMTVEKTKQIVLFTEKNLIGLALTDGKLLWQLPAVAKQRYFSAVSPYINGQTVYYSGLGTGTNAIKISKQGDKFVAEELWSNESTGSKFNTPVLKDGFLYGFTDQKRIYCINASTGKATWIDNAVSSDFGTILDCGSVLIGLTSTSNLIVLKPESRTCTEVVHYKVSDAPIFAYPIIAGNFIYIKDDESLTLYKIN